MNRIYILLFTTIFLFSCGKTEQERAIELLETELQNAQTLVETLEKENKKSLAHVEALKAHAESLGDDIKNITEKRDKDIEDLQKQFQQAANLHKAETATIIAECSTGIERLEQTRLTLERKLVDLESKAVYPSPPMPPNSSVSNDQIVTQDSPSLEQMQLELQAIREVMRDILKNNQK